MKVMSMAIMNLVCMTSLYGMGEKVNECDKTKHSAAASQATTKERLDLQNGQLENTNSALRVKNMPWSKQDIRAAQRLFSLRPSAPRSILKRPSSRLDQTQERPKKRVTFNLP